MQLLLLPMISGFRREVYENCALLGHYAASSGLLAIPSNADKVNTLV